MNPKEFAQLIKKACDLSSDPKVPVGEKMIREMLQDGAKMRRTYQQIGGSYYIEVFYEDVLFLSESSKPFEVPAH